MTAYMKPLFLKMVGTLRHKDGTRRFKCGFSELHRKVWDLFWVPPFARISKA